MFGFKKPKAPEQQTVEQTSFFGKLKAGLSKTQTSIFGGAADLLHGKKTIDAAFLDDLEERLLVADLGIHATTEIIDALHSSIKRNEISDYDQLRQTLGTVMGNILDPVQKPLTIPVDKP
ncbi:MAG: signal recognition particle-docking protein FtsY, partial [Gammaproteobacteria bacterium]